MEIARAKLLASDAIPVIDIGVFLKGSEAGKQAVADQIADAAETVGFFYISGHGISYDRIEAMFDLAARFFALPEAEKNKLALQNSPHFRGFLPIAAKGADKKSRGNNQEAFQIQKERTPGKGPEGKCAMFGPNQWPLAMPELKPAMLSWWAEMERISDALLRAFALGLGLPERRFDEFYEDSLTQLRLLHYPPQEGEIDEGFIGIRPHTDTGAFTILLQDTNGGLEVLGMSGEWVQATPIEGSFVIYIADMIQSWTNGRFRSTGHRVVNRSGKERYSIPYFVNPGYDAIAQPLPEFVNAGENPVFEPIHVGDFIFQRFNRIWPRAGQ